MANPTDGTFIYDESVTSLGSGFYTPRLQQIAAGGFSLVMNYDLLLGHIADVTGYINAATTAGLKVIIYLADPAIWKNATYATAYPLLYADAGSPGTGTAFMQYIVNQTKALAGTWGWYVGDEVVPADHTTFHTYAVAVATADSTHPRLVVEGSGSTSVSSQTNLFFDCAEVIGDDWYPLGNTSAGAWTTPGIEAAGIQNYVTAHSKQAAMVLQAFSWTQSYPPARANNWPTGAPWPTAAQMRYNRDQALANCNFRVMGWYSYFNCQQSDDPLTHWNDLIYAANGVGSAPTEPAILASALFFAYATQTGWTPGWTRATGTLIRSIASGVGSLTGATDANYFLLGAGSTLRSTSSYVLRFGLSSPTTGKAGLVFNWIDSSNFLRVDANATTARLVSVVAGVETVLQSGSASLSSTGRYYLKCIDTGTSYVVKLWQDTSPIETATLFTVSHSATTSRIYQYGVYAQLGATGDTASIFNFAAFDLAPPASSPPTYYVATTGSDSNPGTQAQPFATIQHAADLTSPGATVYVQPGTYNSGEVFTSISGTSTQRIQYIALGSVFVRTTGTTVCWGCQGNYIDVIGFDISGNATATAGFAFYGAFNTAQRLTVSALSAPTATGIQDTVFPCSDNQFMSCVVKNIGSNGSSATGAHLFMPRTSIVNCLIFQAGRGLIADSQTGGMTVANNLIANCSANGLIVWGNTSLADNIVGTNNIIISCAIALRETGTTGTNNQYVDNLFSLNTTNIILQNGNVDNGSLFANPLLINYQGDGSGDYHLTVSSPCVNAGTSLGAPATDVTGKLRSLKASIDIGPYLYIAAVMLVTQRRVGTMPPTKRRGE